MNLIKDCLQKDGIVLVDGLFDLVELNTLIREGTELLMAKIPDWKEGINKGDMSSVFLDLELPNFTSFLREILQKKLQRILDDLQYQDPKLKDVRLRLTAPYPLPYVQWHRDHLIEDTIDVRITIYLSDVYPESGEFCFVKGSHLPDANHLRHSDPEIVGKQGYTAFPGKKGTAIIFNPYGVHGVRANNSNYSRLSLMFYFHFSSM